MNNFKEGSGDLDFGESEDTEDQDETPTDRDEVREENRESEQGLTDQNGSSASTQETAEKTASGTLQDEYPYFVRRNNVGDERDNRLEIHVRDKVVNQEAEFRNTLANKLETDQISKTDAREFALLVAFRNPERVAELMQNEGFDALD